MKKGEIPWIYNEAFEPHYFSIYDSEGQTKPVNDLNSHSEVEDLNFLDFEVF